MKYIIWGCGKRGTALALLLGKNLISAFVDSNPDLIGSSYMGIPIIDFDECLLKRQHELIIIAVKGCEKTIGMRLGHADLPWIAVETPECIYILNQLRLVFDNLINRKVHKMYLIKGWSVYGIFVYECLKARGRECSFFLDSSMPNCIRELEVPIIEEEFYNEKDIERIFLAVSDNVKYDKSIGNKVTNVCEIYKNFELFYNPEIERFHNIHKGKRCFIVATGPSLCVEDLDKLYLHNEICMSVNGIFKVFGRTQWRPDYYFISDLYGILQWQKDILQMDVKEKFIADTGWWFDDVPKNIHRFHIYENCIEENYPKFTDDFSKCAYISNSIIYDGALQMAVYMGFSEIYMLGADCTIAENQKKQHFIEDYEDETISKSYGLDIPQLLKGYESAKRYCKQHGISLYNATRGGTLEVLERVNFDNLF